MYRDILVHLKAREDWSGHIDAAIALAQRSRARLTGLLSQREIALAKQLAPGPGATDILASLQEDAAELAERLRSRFVKALADAGVEGAFESAEGRANEVLTLAGRFHDLIVIEQTDPRRDESNWESAEEAAVQSGRPTLIIPAAGDFTAPFARILVAWNGSREAARALHASLPLIEACDSVVLAQGRGRERMASITKAPGMDIEAYLSRHAKSVTLAARDVADPEAGHVLVEIAKAHGCHLIVMGAYGRTGLSDWIFGSATQALFKTSPVPILAAH